MTNEIQARISSDRTHSQSTDIFDGGYHRFNKRLLCWIGLWPDQPLSQRIPNNIGLLVISATVMTGQVRAMAQVWGQFNSFVECLPPLVMNWVGLVKLICNMCHTGKMKKVFNMMQADWDEVRHLPQVKFLETCAETGRRWTLFYFTLIYAVTSGWIVLAFSPKVLDKLMPLNYSRRRFDLCPMDLWADPDEYFFAYTSFLSFSLYYQLLVIAANDTIYMVIAQHMNGSFKILRYNLHNILQDAETNEVFHKPHINKIHYNKIVSCIKKHKIIIDVIADLGGVFQSYSVDTSFQYTRYVYKIVDENIWLTLPFRRTNIQSVESTCEWNLFFIVGLSMLALSTTGYLVITSSGIAIFRFGFFGIAQIFHLFCNSLPGHWIMESSAIVMNAAYSSRWYAMLHSSKKLVLFLLRASGEPCKITAGKVYVMSMENFSGVLQTSMSYLTMLNSMQ